MRGSHTILIMALAACLARPPASAAAGEIASVSFGADGAVLGQFQRGDNGNWFELDAAGTARFEFTEISRDDSVIVLEDRSRNIALTLDLAGGIITYGVIGEPQEPLYAIISSSAAAPSPATSAMPTGSVVTFGENGTKSGQYLSDDAGTWRELNSAGEVVFSFVEKSRTADRIELEDSSRNLALTLDLSGNVITFGEIGGAQDVLYQILDARIGQVSEASVDQAAQPGGETDGAMVQPNLAAETDPALLVSAEPPPPQVKLKLVGWYTGRFTVTWTPSGTDVVESWTSGPQQSPFYQLLPLPPDASAIRILGEAEQDGTWTAVLDQSTDQPSGRCYVLEGTNNLFSGVVGDGPSPGPDDDC